MKSFTHINGKRYRRRTAKESALLHRHYMERHILISLGIRHVMEHEINGRHTQYYFSALDAKYLIRALCR